MDPEAILSQLRLTGAIEDADLSDFDFELLPSDAAYIFRRCRLDGNRIKGDALAGSRWNDCAFLRCAIISANLEDTIFDNCRFFDGDEQKGCQFRFANLRDVTFRNCDLSMSALIGCSAHQLVAVDCRMRGLVIENTDFLRDFGKMERNIASFDNCDLADAILKKTNFSACTFRDCKLSDIDLSSSNLAKAEFLNCDLHNADFDEADLTSADMRRSVLTGMDLTLLRAYSGMLVSAGQQHHLLKSIGIEVWPDE